MTFVSVSFCYPSGRTFAGGPNCQKSRISAALNRGQVLTWSIGRKGGRGASRARCGQDERGLPHPQATMRPGAQGLRSEGSVNSRYD